MNNSKLFHILLIEANDDHADLIRESFEAHRVIHSMIHLKDGEQALNYLFSEGGFSDQTSNPKPDLILLDLQISKIDGFSVLRKIKEEVSFNTIPVVILTASENENDITRAYDIGINSYLVKPVDFNKFATLTRSLGLYWLILNEQPLH